MWRWILCHILQDHEWTCAASEGIPPTVKQLQGDIEGFYDYARMYCKHCKKESELNARRYTGNGC